MFMKKEICSNKKYILGIDIGNFSTEVALAALDESAGSLTGYGSALHKTTGLKGTPENIAGMEAAIERVLAKKGIEKSQIRKIRINEAAPVIGDFAMETITKTVITESTMIGHNPDTPGGAGVSAGFTIPLEPLLKLAEAAEKGEGDLSGTGKAYIVIISEEYNFKQAAGHLNLLRERGIDVAGAILQNDDGVLISNRLNHKIPIVDEVKHIEKIPLNMLCAIEVAPVGAGIQTLSNPYGIATLMKLTPEETRCITPVAKALAGLRSAVVIKTPPEQVREKTIPLGKLIVKGAGGAKYVDVSDGADEIMETIERTGGEPDIRGEMGTAVGGVICGIKERIGTVIGKNPQEILIRDMLAVDTVVPQKISGGFQGEYANENAIALAAMVKTESTHMQKLAEYFEERTGIPVEVVGIEANMAALGTLTTPGSDTPLAVVDIGAGSTDACYYGKDGQSRFVHLAGAGNMVSMIINSEMNLNNMEMAEMIKKYPLAKSESFFSIRHEDGTVQFFDEALPKETYGRLLLVTEEKMVPIETKLSLEQVRHIRRGAKESILVRNMIRGLKRVSPTSSLTAYSHVLMVGGSALDFELCGMVTETLERYGITAGRANIMGTEGPRGAVATGLLLSAGGMNHE